MAEAKASGKNRPCKKLPIGSNNNRFSAWKN
jgi:hypothetical protein